MEASTSDVLLRCLNVLQLTQDQCPSLQHLADGRVYSRLVSILKNEQIVNQNLASLTPTLEALLQEHFAATNLVVFEEAVGGNREELTKLTLLLLYIALFTDAKLRGRLVNTSALDQATQARFKYLLEAVQKRGASLSSRFLHILCTEEVGARSPSWAPSQVNGAELSSPRVYTTSPKSSIIASPLRELVQSPHFRLQELLNSRKREVKRLQQQLTALESDKQEMTLTISSGNTKVTKLREEVSRLQAKLQATQQQQDEVQAQAMMDDNLKLQQVKELAARCSQLRKENTSLQQTDERLKEENDDLTARNSSLRQQLLHIRLDKDRLEGEVSSLREAKFENESLIESQASDIREMKTQLEELRQYLMDHKSASVSIEESFGNSPLHFSSSHSSNVSGEENMAEAVVEKVLKEELIQLQLQHSALQQDFDAAATTRDQLTQQAAAQEEHMRCLAQEVEDKARSLASLTEQLSGAQDTINAMLKEKEKLLQDFESEKVSLSGVIKAQEDSLSALQQQVKESLEENTREKSALATTITLKEEECKDLQRRLEDTHRTSEEDKVKFASILQEKEQCITDLKEQMGHLRTHMSEEKAALEAQVKLTEEATHNQKVAMESTMKLLVEEKDGEIQRKEKCIAKLESEKDSLLKMHQEERSLLATTAEEHKRALEALQQRLDSVTGQHTTDKEKLESELRCSQESCSSLVQELQAAQDSHEAWLAKQQLLVQEKMTEVTCLEKQIETLKEIQEDLQRKSEVEVQRLSASLEAEQQCVAELRQEAAALLEARSRDTDCLDRLRESNEMLDKEIKELKDCTVTLQNSKQVLEGEKVELITNLREKEKYISEQKEEIVKLRDQVTEERAAAEDKIKTLEKDSYDGQQKMESTIKSVMEEKEKTIQEKENLIAELQSEKDSLSKMLHEEECLLATRAEEHRSALEALHQKLDAEADQHTTEKKKLDSEVLDLTKKVETLEKVKEDLQRKSEGEAKRLSASLEAEQQCVAELRQEVAALMDTKCKDTDCLDRLRESNEKLDKEIKELKAHAGRADHSKQVLEGENSKLAADLQEKGECIAGLKEELDRLRTQITAEKAAAEAKLKTIENDSHERQQTMECTIKSFTEEKAQEIQEKENLIAELQSEKDSLSKMLHEEKCLLATKTEELRGVLEALHQKLDAETSRHDAVREKLEREGLDHIKKVETLNVTVEDLQRKSEAEVQRLSASLEAEQQCVAELRQEVAALMDSRSRDTDHTVRLRESNDELNKEVAVLKGSLAEVTEKYSTLQRESGEAAHHHKTEVSRQEERLAEKEGALSLLLKEVEDSKQVFEEEKSKLAADLEAREERITQLRKEICEAGTQMEKEKSAHDAQVKVMEGESGGEKQRLEATVQAIKEEKARVIQGLEELVAELQREKDEVCQSHQEEKCALTEMAEEHKAALVALQGRLEDLTSQHRAEKEQLESDLQATRTARQEAETKSVEAYRESIQELSEEVARLKGCVAEQKEKYLLLREETEEATQHHTSQEEAQARQQLEVEQALRTEMEHCKQVFEEEKLSLATTVREREETIVQLREEKLSLATTAREREETIVQLREEKLSLATTVREKEETIVQLREEIKQLTGRLGAEQDALQRQADTNRQTLEHERLLMSSKTEDTLLGQQQEVSSLQKDLQQAKKQLTDATHNLQQHQAEVAALAQKLAVTEAESKKHHSRVLALESQTIDKEKAVAASEEELRRVEREAEKTVQSLKEEVRAAKEKAKLERGAADTIRKTYKTEVEKLTLRAAEWEREKKEREILQKKYETAKKKLGETVTHLDEARTANRHYQQQLSQVKECMKKLEESVQREKLKGIEAQNRVLEVEGKYQPLKEKNHEQENTIKRLGTEKRSLEMQLHHAEGQIKEHKKLQRRESFWEQEVPASSSNRLTRMSISDSQVLGRRTTRSATTSSSADEYLGCNDSTEKLLPKKRTRDHLQRGSASSKDDSVFLKPKSQTMVAGGGSISSDERVAQREALAASLDTQTKRPGLPPPEIILDHSLGKSIPRSMHFRCDEEEEELFNNKYLHDMKNGNCIPVGDEQWRRVSELQRRNSLYPPHMRSAYPVEMQFRPLDDFEDDKLREGCAIDDRQLLNLTAATENLELDSPAFNLRKRKSPSDSIISETSLDSSDGKKTRRLSTSYSRPGPPTPGRRLSRGDKENRRESNASELSLSLWQGHRKEGASGLASRGGSPVTRHPQPDASRATRRKLLGRTTSSSSVRSQSSPARSPTVLSKKGMSTPQARKGMTPSSLRKILAKGKSPWRKLDNNDETPKGLGDSTNSNGSSKLRIFRKPFGSRNYNVLSASLRSQERLATLDDSLTNSAGHSSAATTELRPRRRK